MVDHMNTKISLPPPPHTHARAKKHTYIRAQKTFYGILAILTGTPNNGFLLNALKTLFRPPEYF